MNETNDQKIGQFFIDGILIDQSLNQAVQKAVWKHKVLGNPVAAWRDGKVVWIPPEEINLLEKPSIDRSI